jgi:U3 small nucleolar RNA-associated protein 21
MRADLINRTFCIMLTTGPIAKKATSLSTPIASLKLPPITSLSYSSTRWKDWDDVLSAHKQDSMARTWLLKDKKLGKWCFSFVDADKEKKRRTSAGCVTVNAFHYIQFASS